MDGFIYIPSITLHQHRPTTFGVSRSQPSLRNTIYIYGSLWFQKCFGLSAYEGFHRWGIPNLWMVYTGKSYEQMDDNWGLPP